MNSEASTINQQFVFKKSNISLRITCDSLVVCSNKFRQHIATLFDVQGIFLAKTGPQRKYFREGVIRLATGRGLPGSCPFTVVYKSHVLTMWLVSEAEADRQEKESQKKMYVGGVGRHTSVQEVERYFGYFGPVAFVQLMGQAKSEATRFGFVIFEDHRAMNEVYRYGLHFLHGYRLRVTDYVNNSRNKKNKGPQNQKAGGPVSTENGSEAMMQAARSKTRLPVSLATQQAPAKIIRRLPTLVEVILRDASGLKTHSDYGTIRFNLAVPQRFTSNLENRGR